MSTDEYVPDEMDARGCFLDGAAGAFIREDWEAFLARVRRDAAREVGQYIDHLHPERTAKEAVRADIELAADRMGRGLYANGRKRDTP